MVLRGGCITRTFQVGATMTRSAAMIVAGMLLIVMGTGADPGTDAGPDPVRNVAILTEEEALVYEVTWTL